MRKRVTHTLGLGLVLAFLYSWWIYIPNTNINRIPYFIATPLPQIPFGVWYADPHSFRSLAFVFVVGSLYWYMADREREYPKIIEFFMYALAIPVKFVVLLWVFITYFLSPSTYLKRKPVSVELYAQRSQHYYYERFVKPQLEREKKEREQRERKELEEKARKERQANQSKIKFEPDEDMPF